MSNEVGKMKGILKFTAIICSILCLIWGTVLTVLAWNGEVDNAVIAEVSVEPYRAMLAAGIIMTAGVVIFLMRNKVKTI